MSEQDDWDDEPARPRGHPVIAAIIGSIVIMTIGVSIPAGSNLYYAAGAAIGTAIMVGGIAFAITIRHASHRGMVASLATIGIIALLAGVAAFGRANRQMRTDLAAFTEIRAAEDGRMIVPPDMAQRGPISRIIATMADDLNSDLRTYQATLREADLTTLLQPAYVASHPAILDDCDRFLALKSAATHYEHQKSLRIQQAIDRSRALDIAPEFLEGFIKGMEEAKKSQTAVITHNFDIERSMIDEAVALCRVLRRRHWVHSKGQFLFTNTSDLAEFRRHATQFDTLNDEQQRLAKQTLAKVRQRQEIVRQGLDNPDSADGLVTSGR